MISLLGVNSLVIPIHKTNTNVFNKYQLDTQVHRKRELLQSPSEIIVTSRLI
jgi:hypothetical protein